MKNLSIFILFFIITQPSHAQQAHWDAQLLEQTKGKKVIKWIETQDSSYWLTLVQVKKKTGLFWVGIDMCYYPEEDIELTCVGSAWQAIPPLYDEIRDFIPIAKEDLEHHEYLASEHVEVAEVVKKKKIGIVFHLGNNWDGEYTDAKDFFDEINWEYIQGSFVPVRVGDMWGIYDWYLQNYLFECDYESIDDLPKTTDPYGFNDYSAEIFREFNKKYKDNRIDLIDMDGNNGDGLFKARNSETLKWGLYQYMWDKFLEAIPMQYDSLYHFSWNGNYTAVFNDGKVGIYLSNWTYGEEAKESVPCIYEDYKNYRLEDQTLRLAMKKDGKWGWVDWLTGEEKSEFKYDDPDDLPYPYYEQETWFEEE